MRPALFYVNLKEGSRAVYGHVIRVDRNKPLESRLESLTSNLEFNAVDSSRGHVYYRVEEKEERGPNALHVGIMITRHGNVRLFDRPNFPPLYLYALTPRKAWQLVRDCQNWRSLQLWVQPDLLPLNDDHFTQ